MKKNTLCPSLGLIFPGQGSQKVGMLSDLAKNHPVIIETFSEASDSLSYDLWDLSQNGTKEDIMLTERTQPLLLTASVAIWRLWCKSGGPSPAYMAGHSLGEWSALVCSGVVSFDAAVRLVRKRGAYMQDAVPLGAGAMAAVIGLDDEIIKVICLESCKGQEVSAVNFNSPGQVVIAGNTEAVNRAMVSCKDAGAKRILSIPVSAPFHTNLMKPAAEKLSKDIEIVKFSPATIPVVHNVNARIQSEPESIKELIIEQIFKPVLWVDCIETMANNGVTNIVECGAGKVLSGLCKRINSSIKAYSTEDASSLSQTLSSL
ncbi:MAG: ACP S-malonyltransferase [Cellvibrionales bacterium]|jgi:[acyl-carrier-protein] S-malonyltransferase|nr:ACP S-malonyltransferase [Cellvibrionales bacterium]MCH9797271.1 ACP S-malonyltransferase [Gammaproteobacteria bacterium]MDA7737500.1 ACP S-malonyltransferase [Porticoccus sp.]MBT7438081.1 ACP S-malonyltransferase [Cellvibrionales bacterium]MDC0887502.1 ACP S-malonyltransferase [Porticoccus sp.]